MSDPEREEPSLDPPAQQLATEAIYQAIYRSGSGIRRPQRATLLVLSSQAGYERVD